LRSFRFGQFLGKHSNKCLPQLSNIYIVELSNKIFDQKLLHLACQFFYRSSFPFPGLDSCQTFGSRHTRQKMNKKSLKETFCHYIFGSRHTHCNCMPRRCIKIFHGTDFRVPSYTYKSSKGIEGTFYALDVLVSSQAHKNVQKVFERNILSLYFWVLSYTSYEYV